MKKKEKKSNKKSKKKRMKIKPQKKSILKNMRKSEEMIIKRSTITMVSMRITNNMFNIKERMLRMMKTKKKKVFK